MLPPKLLSYKLLSNKSLSYNFGLITYNFETGMTYNFGLITYNFETGMTYNFGHITYNFETGNDL